MGRLQQYAGVEDLLPSSEETGGDEHLVAFNRVNEIIAKWSNIPSKQPLLADLMKLRHLFASIIKVWKHLDHSIVMIIIHSHNYVATRL